MKINRFKQFATRLALGLILVTVASLIGARAAHAQGSALPNDGRFYQIRQPSGTTYSQLYVLDRYNLGSGGIAVGSATPTGTVLNALGLNPIDGYAYAMRNSTTDSSEIFRLGNGTPQSLGLLSPKLAALSGTNFGAACFDGAGNFYITTINAGKTNAKGVVVEPQSFYRISNLAGAADTSAVTVTEIPLSQSVAGIGLNDIAYNPADGLIYGTSSGDPRTLSLINPTTGNVTFRTIIGDSSSLTGATFGTNFFDLTGSLYTYANEGKFNVIDPTTAQITFLATASASSVTDGASNPFYRVPMDVSKTLVAGVAVDVRTRDFTFEVTAQNQSPTESAPHFQITENLARTFAVNSPTISITAAPTRQSGATIPLNANFNGTTDTRLLVGTNALAANSSVVLRFTVRVQYADAASVPAAASNVVYASSTSTVNPAVGYNAGFIFPSGDPVPPPDIIGSDDSTPVDAVLTKVSGRVYEDVNFGGGVGRAFSAAPSAAGVIGARVEIYNASGAFVGFTTTGANGLWNYDVGSSIVGYFARVVNSSVLSTRAGSTAALRGVQTFRTDDGAALTTEVGGRAPAQSDAGNAATGTTLDTTTFALSGATTGQAQSVARLSSASANADFGFNFDLIVNTNDTGQGSLRQFILNSNALTNGGLNQQGLNAGKETSIFQIPKTDANFKNGVAKITLASGLIISDANTALDGTTQTRNIGDTNAGTFGVGGKVGTQNVDLPTLQRPEIEIYGPRTINIGLDINADGALVTGVSMWGFGSTGNSSTYATIRAGVSSGSSFVAPTIREVLLGTSAIPSGGGLFVPAIGTGAGSYGSGDLISGNGVKNGQILNSILSYSGGKGVTLAAGADKWTIAGNEFGNDSRDSNAWDGIDTHVAGTTITGNLVYLSGGSGIDSYSSTGGGILRNNTVRNNGQLCTPTTGEPAGIRSYGTGNITEFNVVYHNYGAGVLVQATGTALISRNSIYGNGQFAPVNAPGVAPSYQIGIDLLKAGDPIDHGVLPYVTPNDAGDGDAGANGLLNFPVITGYEIAGGTLTLEGFAPAGSTVELFAADPDASGFGQGKTYLFSFVEGGPDDKDDTTGAYDANTLQAAGYSAAVANKAGSETAANRFRIVVPANGLAPNTPIAATSTLNNQTSEFSLATGTIPINKTTVNGAVYLDANRNGTLDGTESGIGINNLFVKAVLSGQNSAAQAVAVDAATGAYSFSGLAAGNYNLVLDDNATLTDIAPAIPDGYIGTQAPDGTRQLTVGTQSILSQNFGLFNGAQISGNVSEDNGAGTGAGLANVKINLTKNDGTLVDTTTTDASGKFSFRVPNSVGSGPLKVVEFNPSNYLSVSGSAVSASGTYDLPSDTISFAYTAGATYNDLKFGDVRGVAFTGEDSKTGTIGSSVFYPHVFTSQTAGIVTFATTQLTSPNNTDWGVVAFRDSNGNGQLDGGDAQITAPLSVEAGVPITIFLQNFIPTTAANGAQDKLTVTATFTPTSGAVQTLSLSDLTTVAANQGLMLTKTVSRSTAKSGDILTYTIEYRNTGADALTKLVVRDATPAYTRFVSAADGTRAAGLTDVTIATPGANNKGAVSWTFAGILNPGQSGTVTFRVEVD